MEHIDVYSFFTCLDLSLEDSYLPLPFKIEAFPPFFEYAFAILRAETSYHSFKIDEKKRDEAREHCRFPPETPLKNQRRSRNEKKLV